MVPASDPELLVLLSLRLKSVAPGETVSEVTGVPVEDVDDQLDTFAGKGWVVRRDGRLSGWSLTPAGRVEGAGRLADELAATGARPAVEAAYRGFGALNQRFLQICTDWQVRPGPDGAANRLNDHTDAAYDRRVLDDLRAVHLAVGPVCADLAGALARFGAYGERFARALRRVEDGDLDWFTRPLIDSYHTVWFELHEDLLATLGLDRSQVAGRPARGSVGAEHPSPR